MSALPTDDVTSLLLFSQRAFLDALAALIAFKLLNGSISTRGLLRDRETGRVSALRLQMLIATAITSASFAASLRQQTASHFASVDARLIALVGGSNGLVIVKRAFSRLSQFIRSDPRI